MSLKNLFERLHVYGGAPFLYLSQLCHLVAFRIDQPNVQFEKGMFILSIDVDVGSRELGVINQGKNDSNVSSGVSEYLIGKIEERALPLFVDLFNDFEIPVTFAIRGQLVEVDTSILESLFNSPIEYDIAAHGYYHRSFKNLSRSEAEDELKKISTGMKKLGKIPESFVFPRNSVAHLELLEKYGYKCYRSDGGSFVNDRMCIEKNGQLYNVHPSLFLSSRNTILLRKMLDISVERKLPFHAWFHLWNFGQEDRYIKRNIRSILAPVLDYAKRAEKRGTLTFETMFSAAEKAERLLNL